MVGHRRFVESAPATLLPFLCILVGHNHITRALSVILSLETFYFCVPEIDEEQRLVFQAEVADESPDLEVSRYLANVPHDIFMKLVASDGKDRDKDKERPKTKMLMLIIWYSLYCWVVKMKGKQPIYSLRLTDEEGLADTPLSNSDWAKAVKAATEQWKPPSEWDKLLRGETGTSTHVEQVPSWRSILQPDAPSLSWLSSFSSDYALGSMASVLFCNFIPFYFIFHFASLSFFCPRCESSQHIFI